jgi:hypothetical protein
MDNVRSFPYAELAENPVEQILSGSLANDLADGIGGDAQVKRRQLQAEARSQRMRRVLSRGPRAVQSVLMA